MAYDEFLEERIKQVLDKKQVPYLPKKMMGGLCFMVDDKMCVGIVGNELMARIAPEIYESSLQKKGCKEMNFTGRPMKGYVFIDPLGIDSEDELTYWIDLCLKFNPRAKSSKRKKP